MRKQLLAALAAIAATLLLGIGVAVAVDAGPLQSGGDSSSSISSASTHASDNSSTDDDTDESSDAPRSDDSNESESDGSASEHPDNHGKAVSEAAHNCPKGKGHGACVSAVARSDAGK